MSVSKEHQKQEAIKRMKELGIRKEAIDAFQKTGEVCVCFRPRGNCLQLTKAETKAVKEFEEKYGALVFFVTRAVTLFGALDSFLYVGKDPARWADERMGYDQGFTDAYTYNRQHPECSEFGDIFFTRTKLHGLIRTDIDFV